MYEYKGTTLLKTSISFNFVKHWPIQNLFNDEIFQIYGIFVVTDIYKQEPEFLSTHYF